MTWDPAVIEAIFGGLATASGVALVLIGVFRERIKASREREQVLQQELANMTKAVDSMADAIEKSSWVSGEAQRRLQDGVDEIKRGMERLLDRRRD